MANTHNQEGTCAKDMGGKCRSRDAVYDTRDKK